MTSMIMNTVCRRYREEPRRDAGRAAFSVIVAVFRAALVVTMAPHATRRHMPC